MRKGFFALMLVAASFAGGAMVNGPGLRWVQAMILNRPGSDGAPSSSDVLLPPPDVSAGSIPSAPIPPLVVSAEAIPSTPTPRPVVASARPDASKVKGQDGEKGRESKEEDASAGAAPAPKAPSPPEPKAPGSLVPAPTGRDGESLAAKPSKETPMPLDPLPPLELPAEPSASKGREAAGPDQPWGDAPGSAPAAAVPPRPSRPAKPATRPPAAGVTLTAATAAPAAKPQAPGDWTQIRRTMTALGVTRYGIDGEPGGRVRFYCIIPMAGRRAVGQHFEAEGDDEFQAARVALQRVALWRAGEDPAP